MNKTQKALSLYTAALFCALFRILEFISMAQKSVPQELGFGKYIAVQGRMMRPDGTFNVVREGSGVTDDLYFKLITMSWPLFLGWVFLAYVLLNVVFATLYTMFCGQLTGIESTSFISRWVESFFFSTQTLTTVGYGRVAPIGFATNLIASFESFIGLLGFALISGLLYGRFSRPAANILFSDQMLVSPYGTGKGLMFRIANQSKSELINAEVTVLMAYSEVEANGTIGRVFRNLPLQINTVMFFTFSWTIVHPINEESLVWGWTEQDFMNRNPEFFVLVKAVEEANQQIVHARYSYIGQDLVWDAKFKPIVSKTDGGMPLVLLDKMSEYERNDK